MDLALSPLEVVKRYVANFERKQRNLAKRKSKLDQYRDKLAKGESLNEEQKKAVEDYDCVVHNINMLHEIIAQSKELVDDVEEAVKNEESRIQLSHEQHTISFLHMHVCLMRLLTSLDSDEVRSAVLKSTSENHLKMLDTVRNLVTAPVLDHWPGTTPASLASAPAFVHDHPEVKSAALHAYHLSTGRPTPIPTPENYDGPPKKLNFKEARALCLRLLATPPVIRSLGLRTRTCSSTSVSEAPKLEHTTESANLNKSSRAVYHDNSHPVNQETTVQDVGAHFHTSPKDLEQVNVVPMPVILDQVIKPLGGTFNFLQASSIITATDSVSGTPQTLAPTSYPSSDMQPDSNFTPVLDLAETLEHAAPIPDERCSPPPHTLNSAVADDVNPTAANVLHTIHANDSLDSHHKLETSPAEPSKPVSYADLVRRLNHTRPSTNLRGKAGDAASETRLSRGLLGQPSAYDSMDHENEQLGTGDSPHIPPASFGRYSNDSRGGRMIGRPPSRGNYNGPVRRPVGGGPRSIRFAGAPGRGGGTTFRGTSAGVAQPSC
ncbi:unnamed protein product [Dicrocoelium dendriticum]|nr:unnamed protein product [Dicrocoelium dendriticum]